MCQNDHLPLLVCAVLLSLLAGCDTELTDQPRFEPYERTNFFDDHKVSRPLVEGTVARGHLQVDSHLYQGKVDGELVETFPFAMDKKTLKEGQERYKIFCSACHGISGHGDGMVVKRGFPAPPSFHTDKLREAKVGHYFDVITNGYGRMLPYKGQVPTKDRWKIVGYIRALQLSQSATVSDLPEQDQQELRKSE